MKKVSLVLFCWGLIQVSFGQMRGAGDQGFIPILTVEYGYNTIDPQPLNDFFNSYSTFWGSQVAADWQPVTTGTLAGPQARLGLRYWSGTGAVGFTAASNFMYGYARARRTFTFTNNMGHDLRMRSHNLGWDFHLGIVGDRWYLVSLATAHVRDLTLDMYTTFPDGSRSLGNLYKISGIYEGLVTTFDVGLGVGVALKKVNLTAKLESPLPGFPPARFLVTALDYGTNEEILDEMPRDFVLWATDPVEYANQAIPEDQEVAIVVDSFSGLRLAFGVEIPLFQKYSQ
ncbi:MAG TPA: hypothetical protein DCE41_12240 [Cytophagales bacterium]|nr:hypothetical protein [Cytophagales bacterium]